VTPTSPYEEPAQATREVASLGNDEADMVESAHQGLEVVEPTLASDHHEIDRSGPTGKLRLGETDEESTCVKDPAQRCLDPLKEADSSWR
jgi:hypothetical protein